MPVHLAHRKPARSTVRRPFRPSLRGCLRGRGGPSDFTQMLTAYGRAVRAYRQLARLAPSFFDAAVVDRERANREATRRWLALWEPYLAKAYGVTPKLPDFAADLPRLPHLNTQRAVERRLAEVSVWLSAGSAARQRHQQRRPHALPTLSQLARLLQLAFDLKCLALGLNSPNRLPDKITYDDEFPDLKRAYGHLIEPVSAAVVSTEIVLPAQTDGNGDQCCPLGLPAPIPPSKPPSLSPPVSPRCDAWSRLTRQMRRGQGVVQ